MIILDACAIIAYLRDEEGSNIVEEALISEECYIHAINMCEVYTDCLRRGDERLIADQILDDLYLTGLSVREDMDSLLWKEVSHIKALGRISYADCFALSICQRLGGVLYTSDHHELEPIAEKGNYSIHFFR